MSAYEKYMAELPEDVERLEAECVRWFERHSRLSAENADAQAKEAFALGKLEETLKFEGELRAEIKRLEALDKDWLRASEQWAAENSRLKSQLDEFVYAENNPTYESEAERLQKIIIKAYQHLGFTGQKNNTMRILGTGLPNAKDSERVSTVPAPDEINDRGSDEYANPERDGDRQNHGN